MHTKTLKGGLRATCYHNASFPRSGDRIVKSNHHTTIVYSSNPLEPLPPLFIFDTKAKTESNYNIDPSLCQGLPKVQGKYGTGHMQEWASLVAMRPKGGMDKTLFPLFLDNVILPCYPYIQKETVCNETGRKIKGPLFLKTDTGPGCLCKVKSTSCTRKN